MKKDIHPKYYHDTKVACACGNSFITGSTLKEISVEICSKCHPFYTGKQKLVDNAGRVERFEKLMKKGGDAVGKTVGKKIRRQKRKENKEITVKPEKEAEPKKETK